MIDIFLIKFIYFVAFSEYMNFKKQTENKQTRQIWLAKYLEFRMGFSSKHVYEQLKGLVKTKIDFNPLFWYRAGRTGDERTTEQCVMWPPEGHILFTFVARKIFSDFS